MADDDIERAVDAATDLRQEIRETVRSVALGYTRPGLAEAQLLNLAEAYAAAHAVTRVADELDRLADELEAMTIDIRCSPFAAAVVRLLRRRIPIRGGE